MSGGPQQSHTAWQDCEELRSLGFVKGRLIKRIMHARGWAHGEVRPRPHDERQRRAGQGPQQRHDVVEAVPEREREQRQHADEREPRQRTPPPLTPARHQIADREQL